MFVYIWLGALTYFVWRNDRSIRITGQVLTAWARKYGRKWDSS